MTKPPPITVSPEHMQIVREILKEHVSQYEVWAFGSRTSGKLVKPHSDLDLAIITDQPLSIKQNAALEEAFLQSDLPWKVDIVDWATTSPAFQAIIEQQKVVVQTVSDS